jgi:hypothetical protein
MSYPTDIVVQRTRYGYRIGILTRLGFFVFWLVSLFLCVIMLFNVPQQSPHPEKLDIGVKYIEPSSAEVLITATPYYPIELSNP